MYAENKKKNGFFPFSFFSVFPENLFFQGWRNVFEKSVSAPPVGSEGVSQTVSKPFLVFFSCPFFCETTAAAAGNRMAWRLRRRLGAKHPGAPHSILAQIHI